MESPDGKLLYYLKTREGLLSVPVEGGNEAPILKAVDAGFWTVAEKGIKAHGGHSIAVRAARDAGRQLAMPHTKARFGFLFPGALLLSLAAPRLYCQILLDPSSVSNKLKRKLVAKVALIGTSSPVQPTVGIPIRIAIPAVNVSFCTAKAKGYEPCKVCRPPQ